MVKVNKTHNVCYVVSAHKGELSVSLRISQSSGERYLCTNECHLLHAALSPQAGNERLLLEALSHFAYLSVTSPIFSFCDCFCSCLHTCLPRWSTSPPRVGVWKFLSEISKDIPSGFHLILRVGFCEKTWTHGFCLGLFGKALGRR